MVGRRSAGGGGMTHDELKRIVMEWKLATDADGLGSGDENYFRRADAERRLDDAASALLEERYEGGWNDA